MSLHLRLQRDPHAWLVVDDQGRVVAEFPTLLEAEQHVTENGDTE